MKESKLRIKVQNCTFCIVIFIFVFCILDSAYAAPCYGTKMPGKSKVFMGLQYHAMFKRYLEDNFGKVRSQQYFLLLSLGVTDWFSIDLKGGGGDIRQRPNDASEVKYSPGFAGGYGLRLRLFEKENWRAVFGFQHISVHPKSKHVSGIRNKAVLDDWQTSLLVSYDFKKFTPYLGTRWSRVDYIHKVDTTRKRRMSDLTKDLGLIYGVDIPLNDKVWVNLEGNNLDSDALAVSINYSF